MKMAGTLWSSKRGRVYAHANEFEDLNLIVTELGFVVVAVGIMIMMVVAAEVWPL
jgi:hypothetical protein